MTMTDNPAVQKKNTNNNSKGKKTWRDYLKRGVTVFFFILVPVLLYFLLRDMEWADVRQALQSYSLSVLAACVGITVLSYLLLSSFDLLGRYQTRHGLPVVQVLPRAFVCYSFNLNFGAWVGGIALRYRLYSKLGLSVPVITGILSISIMTNWLGYMLVAGTLFAFRLINLPDSWNISITTLQFIGFGLVAAAMVYFAACQFSRNRTWSWKGHRLTFPSLKVALLQAAMGAANWCLVATLIYLLLPDDVSYPTVLAIFMVSSIAGVVTHIPAGLGVLEAVFIGILRGDIATGTLLAALLTYRAVYFLLPLPIAILIYFWAEKRGAT